MASHLGISVLLIAIFIPFTTYATQPPLEVWGCEFNAYTYGPDGRPTSGIIGSVENFEKGAALPNGCPAYILVSGRFGSSFGLGFKYPFASEGLEGNLSYCRYTGGPFGSEGGKLSGVLRSLPPSVRDANFSIMQIGSEQSKDTLKLTPIVCY